MKNFILGTLFGLVLATIGFSGMARVLDRGVEKVKEVAIEQAK